MTPERHELILGLIKDYKVGAEVGVLKGELSEQILSGWSGHLYLVDAWRHIDGLIDITNPDHNGHLDHMAHAFMAVYKYGDRATMIREKSWEAAKLFQDESLDFVYIDAGHDKQSVLRDLEAWYPKIRSGGLFIGDDYFDAHFHFKDVADSETIIEVKTAVDEFGRKIGQEVYSSRNTHIAFRGTPTEDILKQWWIKKP